MRTIKFLLAILFSIALTACSSSKTPSATYSISGTVTGAAGVTMSLTGAATATATTAADGSYTFASLANGAYTVTPSLAGYAFSPTSLVVTVSDANVSGTSFTATAAANTYSISGTVTGATGVTITLSGDNTGSVLTGAGGIYTIAGLVPGSYTVTPSKTGYVFTPNSTAVTVVGANLTGKDFTASVYTAPTYTLSGAVTGPQVEFVTITMSGDGTGTTTTDASGNYSFANLPAGTYDLLPSLPGYTYSPSNPAVAVAANTTQNFVASSAKVSYSISGTVSTTSTKTGRISIRVYESDCTDCGSRGGTVIAAPGAYTVRGLQNGTYLVVAEMDALGTAISNATNPSGSSSPVTIASANHAGVDIDLEDPSTPKAVTPTIDNPDKGAFVVPGNSSAFIMYGYDGDDSPDNGKDEYGREIATSYKIYWGTDTDASNGGTGTFAAQGDNTNVYILSGLTDGDALYFKISSFVGATESEVSAVAGPVTIGAVPGVNTVSGTVTFPGTATGPLMVGVYGDGGVFFTSIASPVSPQSYSISGVANGSYQSFAVIDMNNNGLIDIGDMTNVNGRLPAITVSGDTTSNLTLSSASATAIVGTDHQLEGTNHSYSLDLSINDGTKRVVAVALISGANVAVPFDMGVGSNSDAWMWLDTISPTVGDTYMFKVTFSDGTTQILSSSVTAVLDSFAQDLWVDEDVWPPTFKWAAPDPLPAYSFTYRLKLRGNEDSTNWDYPKDNDLPSNMTPLEVLYNVDGRVSFPGLTSGNTYTWQVVVQDANRNSATRQATYTAP